MKLVAIADSDSYLKWAAAHAESLSAEWERELVLVRTPVTASTRQKRAALAGTRFDPDRAEVVDFGRIADRVAASDPDAVLLGARGELVRILARELSARSNRPVLVSGVAGISYPVSAKALAWRRQVDLVVAHSRSELAGFRERALLTGRDVELGLASLPFLERGRGASGTDLVFATQAIVPLDRADRRRVARLLVRAARADPSRRVVVKVRAVAGEPQTHAERDGYPELLAELGDQPANLVISTGSMARALDTAEGLVTVSSTAAIEALARGIPVLLLDSFGVSRELVNLVFDESGLLAGEDDVVARRYRLPVAGWREQNYLHDPADDDWAERLGELARARRRAPLPERAVPVRAGGRLRVAWERKVVLGAADRSLSGSLAWLIGVPSRAVVRTIRSVRRVVAPGSAAPSPTP